LGSLIKRGQRILRDANIRYVVLHQHDFFFSRDTTANLRTLLDRSLGKPLLEDQDGTAVWGLVE
jgi:hypothetical protein